jgi:hypothetical protein
MSLEVWNYSILASYPMGNRGFSLGVKRPGCEADNLTPRSADHDCVELYLLYTIRLHGVVLS